MRTALVLHPDVESTTGFLGPALAARGVDLREHTICGDAAPAAAGPLPSLDGAALLVVMGSRWSVYDEGAQGWVAPLLDLIREAVATRVPVLGICFGGQAVAAALGGHVERSDRPEVGWVEVRSPVPTLAGTWFQWHFDRFTPPPGAELLAENDAAPQAFRVGSAVGLQFHPELDPPLLDLWIPGDRAQLESVGVDVESLRTETAERAADAEVRCRRLVDWFLAT